MDLRQDALAGAAEFILAAEIAALLATIGKIEAAPGASNVIPGKVSLTLDARDQKDSRRLTAVKSLQTRLKPSPAAWIEIDLDTRATNRRRPM